MFIRSKNGCGVSWCDESGRRTKALTRYGWGLCHIKQGVYNRVTVMSLEKGRIGFVSQPERTPSNPPRGSLHSFSEGRSAITF